MAQCRLSTRKLSIAVCCSGGLDLLFGNQKSVEAEILPQDGCQVRRVTEILGKAGRQWWRLHSPPTLTTSPHLALPAADGGRGHGVGEG